MELYSVSSSGICVGLRELIILHVLTVGVNLRRMMRFVLALLCRCRHQVGPFVGRRRLIVLFLLIEHLLKHFSHFC